jgi:hypothetical protein
MKITWTCVLATLALFVGSASAHAKEGAKLVQVAAGDLKWEPFYPGGPEEAFIIGSKGAKKGPTAFFIKFKAGFDSGWHVHDSAYTGIILSGTILETDKAAAEPAKSLVAGSYYMQPKTVHRTQCAPGGRLPGLYLRRGSILVRPHRREWKAVTSRKSSRRRAQMSPASIAYK